MPILLKTKPTLALVETRRMSMAQVMVAPTPTAAPLIAAMTGFLHSKIASDTKPPSSRTPCKICSSSPRSLTSSKVGCWLSSRPNTLPSMDRSIPAQKARPAPVTTTAPTASSSLARLKASTSSRAISRVKEFSCSGRFRVNVRMPSDTA